MLAALVTVVAFGTSGNAYSSPTPQATILTAPLGQTVALGDLKIKIEDLRAATLADNPHHLPVAADENLIVMHVILSNNALPSFSGVVTYRLEDKNGYGPRTWERLNIQQRTTVHLHGLFAVGKDYVPTSLLVECSSCNASRYIAVQFTLPAPSSTISPSPNP
jgi:hypothetical protein